jgi:hypothetical protein
MSTSAITRSTREVRLGTTERRSIERRVREAQAELLRSGRRRARQHEPGRRGAGSAGAQRANRG